MQLWHEWRRMYPALLIPEVLLAQHAPIPGILTGLGVVRLR
ncbi:hypothetical protein CES85_3686 (plasmid) [Ochrobactrum quorumnocens]|uniref:Uncharacterized protein n=1 Tax=Ochrobactrum quorumnocens TaxID=271865 RepID=A0A248UPJ0_9HYPH|nr:hypothetical protein CES85_3686 [[Ochrobactrum] quorumnocens]